MSQERLSLLGNTGLYMGRCIIRSYDCHEQYGTYAPLIDPSISLHESHLIMTVS